MFINPFTMFLGGALIASPIIIHLINRVRFKRVRWAAMEFLLKSQKRSRRKMIIEQLILLLLRILLVLLIAFLLARFMGFKAISGSESQYTRHVILLDDTLSMGDLSRGSDGKEAIAFEQAKTAIVEKIAAAASQAPGVQLCEVIRLSDLAQARNFGRINASTIQDLRSYLLPMKPANAHVELGDGLRKAKTLFDAEKDSKHVLHVVSDFRSVDWGDRTQESLTQTFQQLKAAETEVYLFDVAAPERTDAQKNLPYDDNLAITDLRPESRIVVKDLPSTFQVSVANYSRSERKNVFVRVKVNGEEKRDGSVNIPLIRPNETAMARFTITLDRTAAKDAPDPKAAALEAFNVVSAHIENEPAGLSVDNARYAVVEVRDRIPVLLIDSNPANPPGPFSESLYLWFAIQTIRSAEPPLRLEPIVKSPADLATLNLSQYAAVILCGIPVADPKIASSPGLSAAAITNLESYVAGGGGVSVFMGPSIRKADLYNTLFHKEGKGLFPVPLEEKSVNDGKTDAELDAIRKVHQVVLKKLVVPEASRRHPAMERLYPEIPGQNALDDKFENQFAKADIVQYFQVKRDFDLRKRAGTVQPLIFLPNWGSMAGYEARTVELLKKLPVDDEKLGKYREALLDYKDKIARTVAGANAQLPQLVVPLQQLLTDKESADGKRPSMREFWRLPETESLRMEFQRLLDDVQYGDALYIAKQYGKGRVLAYLSSSGTSWNPSATEYFNVLAEDSMFRYLWSAGTDANLTLGNAYNFAFDAKTYLAKANRTFLTPSTTTGTDGQTKADFVKASSEIILPTVTLNGVETLNLDYRESTEPGVAILEFTEQRTTGDKADIKLVSDYRALAFNIDALAESNLERAMSDDVKRIASVKDIHTMNDDKLIGLLARKKNDFSESPWMFLAMLLLLVAEQAMAVRLSFHTKPTPA